jgi:hypothetical protein
MARGSNAEGVCGQPLHDLRERGSFNNGLKDRQPVERLSGTEQPVLALLANIARRPVGQPSRNHPLSRWRAEQHR